MSERVQSTATSNSKLEQSTESRGISKAEFGDNLPDSYWVASATPQIPLVSLDVDAEVDVAIVGAGYTGLRCAIELAEKGISAAVVDVTEPGFGASGRSGGQVNPLPHIFPEEIRKQYGNHHGNLFLHAAVNAADELYGVIDKHGISCEMEQNGWLQGAHAPYRMKLLQERHDKWTREGAQIDVLSTSDVKTYTGSSSHYGGILMKRGGAVHPMSYTRGLAHAAIAAGAKVYSRTPAHRLEKKGDRWVVHCRNGSAKITANKVVIATNGYTDDLLSGLRQTVLPLISVQAVTEPLTDAQLANVLPKRTTFADTRRVIFYTRRVGENRLAFGTLARNDGEVQDSDRNRIHLGIRHVFPSLADVKWDYYWTGRVGHTPDFLPHFHEPEPGIIAGLGFNGRGVAMATVMGRILAERAAGADPASLPFPTTPLKGIPFHSVGRLGVIVTSRWYELLDSYDVMRNRMRGPT